MQAIVNGGVPPFTYDWSVSLKGPFDYTPMPGNAMASYLIPCDHDIPVWFKLAVTGANGVVLSTYKTAYLSSNWNGAQSRKVQSKSFVLTPNPVIRGGSFIELTIPLEEDELNTSFSIEMIDLSGRRILEKESIKGHVLTSYYQLPLENLSVGIYYLSVKNKSSIYTQKLIVQ